MSSSVGRIDLDLGINYNQFNRELNGISGKATNLVGGAFKKLGLVIAGAFAIGGMVSFGRSAIGLASDLSEVQNVVDVTFGRMAQDINNFSKQALESFGLSELSAKKFASTMGAMLKSSGLAEGQMTEMSKSLTGLSADFASFYNLDTEDAFTKISAGIAGETEPLRRLGINMSVANLEAFALTKGITKNWMAMTQAEQVLLRYNYLMMQSADAQGDFARTSGSWANQTRVLAEQWNIFKGVMGQGFINILTPVIRGINVLIQRLQVAAGYFKAFTEMIFGSSKAAGAATATVIDMSTGMEGTSDSIGNVGKAASKAGKAIKGSLAGFDQLNTIGKSASEGLDGTAAGLGDISGGSSSVPALPVPEIDPDNFLFKIMDGISFQPIIDSFNKFKIALEPFTDTLFAGLKWAWDNIFVPFGTWTVEKLIPSFLDLMSGALTILNPLLLSFKPLALFLWDNFLKPIAEWTGGVIIATLDLLAELLKKIGTWMSDNQSVIDNITTSVSLFFGAWKVLQLLAFIQMSGGVVTAIKLMSTALWLNTGAKIANAAQTVYLTLLYAKDFVVSVAKATAALVINTLKWIANTAVMVVNKIAMIASTIAQWAMTAATVAWNIAAGIGAVVATAFGVAVAILTSPITLVILAIAALVAGIILLVKNWDKVKEVASKVWSGIKSVWKTASTWMYDTVIKPIANMYTGLWNGIITGMNFMIKGLNKIKIKVPDWIPGIGGKGFGVNIPLIPKIPKLANGGLVNSPTLAMVGDNKNARVDPEVISPLSKLEEIITRTIEAVMSAQASRGNNRDRDNATYEIVLKLGETELGRAAIKAINMVQRQTGVTLLTI